jgi:hypothetical protein
VNPDDEQERCREELTEMFMRDLEAAEREN